MFLSFVARVKFGIEVNVFNSQDVSCLIGIYPEHRERNSLYSIKYSLTEEVI